VSTIAFFGITLGIYKYTSKVLLPDNAISLNHMRALRLRHLLKEVSSSDDFACSFTSYLNSTDINTNFPSSLMDLNKTKSVCIIISEIAVSFLL